MFSFQVAWGPHNKVSFLHGALDFALYIYQNFSVLGLTSVLKACSHNK